MTKSQTVVWLVAAMLLLMLTPLIDVIGEVGGLPAVLVAGVVWLVLAGLIVGFTIHAIDKKKAQKGHSDEDRYSL